MTTKFEYQPPTTVADEMANAMRRKLHHATSEELGWPGMTSEELIASERISWLEEQAEIRAPAHAFKALGGGPSERTEWSSYRRAIPRDDRRAASQGSARGKSFPAGGVSTRGLGIPVFGRRNRTDMACTHRVGSRDGMHRVGRRNGTRRADAHSTRRSHERSSQGHSTPRWRFPQPMLR